MKRIVKFFLNTLPRPLLIKLSYLAKPFLTFWMRGNRYTDPIDGKGFRSFLPYGYESPRENVLSPSTLSLERHRLLWLYLKKETDFFKAGLKVLHFAPEQAFYERFRALKNLDYTTTDLHSPLADVRADICNLPFENNAFDVVLCNHVLEHIEDDRQAMLELYRILRPGGWGILQVPQDLKRRTTFEDNSVKDKEERARIFGQYDHVRIYGLDYFNKLRSVGFRVNEVDLSARMTTEEVDKFRLAKGELLPVVYKD